MTIGVELKTNNEFEGNLQEIIQNSIEQITKQVPLSYTTDQRIAEN